MPELAERPKIADAPISVVLLSYNAGPDLRDVLLAWSEFLDTLARDHEIILVDDGSNDGTAAAAEALAASLPRLRVLRHEARRGLGAVLRTGIAAAHHPLLFYTTCNKHYQPTDLRKLLDSIDLADLVTGYRVWRPVPFWYAGLRGLGRIFARIVFGLPLEVRDCWLGREGLGRRLLAWWIFRVRVQDCECVYRLCRRSIFEHIPIQSDGVFSQIEILAKANFLSLYLAEAPVTFVPQRGCDESLGIPDAARRTRQDIWRVLHSADFGAAPETQPLPVPGDAVDVGH
jgi:glycosyltransferase involved in cell wall biosynthesis